MACPRLLSIISYVLFQALHHLLKINDTLSNGENVIRFSCFPFKLLHFGMRMILCLSETRGKIIFSVLFCFSLLTQLIKQLPKQMSMQSNSADAVFLRFSKFSRFHPEYVEISIDFPQDL